mgnify:CR=1 FL=1
MPRANYQGSLEPPADPRIYIGQHGTATPASGTLGEFVRTGAMVQTSTGTYALGTDLVQWVDRRGWQTPHIDAVTIFSTTTAGTQTTSTGTWLSALGGLNKLMFLVDITATGGTDPTLDAFVDTDFGGTRVINVARTTLMVGPQAALIILDRSPATGGMVASANADAGGGTVRSVGFGDRVRVRYSIGSNATSQVSFAVYLSGVA